MQKNMELLDEYRQSLQNEDKSKATVNKYMHDIRHFFEYAGEAQFNKEIVQSYKLFLIQKYNTSSVNSMLTAINMFFKYLGRFDLCVKLLKKQTQPFYKEEKELSKAEYQRLVGAAAGAGNKRLAMIIQTVCGMGIRVSELEYVTVEAVKRGYATVNCKGKTRTVFIVKSLREKLKQYIDSAHIKAGTVFVTKNGKPIDRSNIWRDMKKLCESAGVAQEKVFPHNLRHLFARTFYDMDKDIARLADILGHSSIDTTRIYTAISGTEHNKKLELMRLVI